MLGTDIIEISRIKQSATNAAFLNGVFTERELEYYKKNNCSAQTLAGMFCAKEAVSKALCCGFKGFRPCNIEILHRESGEPYAVLNGKARELFPNALLYVSISHCNEYATAVAICNIGGIKG